MPDIEIDCSQVDCRRVQRMAVEGPTPAEIERSGLTPERVRELRSIAVQLLLICCSKEVVSIGGRFVVPVRPPPPPPPHGAGGAALVAPPPLPVLRPFRLPLPRPPLPPPPPPPSGIWGVVGEVALGALVGLALGILVRIHVAKCKLVSEFDFPAINEKLCFYWCEGDFSTFRKVPSMEECEQEVTEFDDA